MVETVDSLGFILLLFIFFVGLFTILSHTNLNSLNLSWTITSGLMLTVTLGTPMLGLYTFVPSRWYAFMYVPMVVIGVFGVRYLLSQLSSRAVVGGILIFALVFPGAMLISHKATTDNTIFDNSYTQYAYSEAELDAASTIIDIHPAGTEIQSDQPYRTLFKRRGHLPAKSLNMSDRGTPKADAVVYRQYQSTDVAKVRYKGEILRVRLPRNAVCTASDDTVYTIGTVQYCRDT